MATVHAEEGETRTSLLQEFLSSILARVFGKNQEKLEEGEEPEMASNADVHNLQLKGY